MSTIEHPRFTQHSYGGPGQKTLITTYDAINSSPTKLKYSFGDSKSKRFPKVDPIRQNGHQQIGYTLPSTKSTRGAGFGIGERFKESKKSKSPSPDRYNPPSLFKPDNTTSTFAVHCVGDKTYSFGTGRESFKKTVLSKGHLGADDIVPGPGSYDPLGPIGSSALSFKLKHKLYYGEDEHIAKKRAVPGAGTYEDQLSLHTVGQNNQNSEFNNSKAQRWAPQYDRFKYPKLTKDSNPGPGQHDQHGELHKGDQVNSLYHSIKSPTFGYGERTRFVGRFKTPGPGSYRAPSDFGYVDVISRNQKERDELAIQTYGFPLDSGTSRMHEGSVTSKRGSIKNRSMQTYYETIPEFGQSRNRFMNKTLYQQGKVKKSITANQGTRVKKFYKNPDLYNQTPKNKRTIPVNGQNFYQRNSSVIQNQLKNDRQESERLNPNRTLEYPDHRKMTETQRMPNSILEDHLNYRTPQRRRIESIVDSDIKLPNNTPLASNQILLTSDGRKHPMKNRQLTIATEDSTNAQTHGATRE